MSSSEREPLQPASSRRHPSDLYGVPRDRHYTQLFQSPPDDDDTSIRIPRRCVVITLIYIAATTIALLACLLILALKAGGHGHTARDRSGGGGVLPPLSSEPTSPAPPRHAPSRQPGPAPPSSDSAQSAASSAHFLVLSDLHLEPHYAPTAPNGSLGVCRDDEHITTCRETDWELLSSTVPASNTSSSAFPLGRYMCDPPYAFLSSALTALASSLSTSTSLSFLLVPGDLVAHFSPCPLTHYHTYDAAVSLLSTAFPDTPLIVAIGNCDVYPTDYSPPSSVVNASSCAAPFASLLSVLLRHGVIDAEDEESIATFCHGGYYARVLHQQRLRVVSLNTQPWATEYTDTPPPSTSHSSSSSTHRMRWWHDNITVQPLPLTRSLLSFGYSASSYPSNFHPVTPLPCNHSRRSADPYRQFRWLQRQISLASLSSPPQHIVLLGHKPPGTKAGQAGWCPQYEQQLQAAVRDWPNVLSALIFGDYSEDRVKIMHAARDHDHGDSAQTSQDEQGKVVHVNPGLSMRKNVNPAARVYDLDVRSGSITDYHQYYVDMLTHRDEAGVLWAYQYSATAYYGMRDYGAEGWRQVARRMLDDERGLLQRYVAGVNVWKTGTGDGVGYVCDMMAMQLGDNIECRRTGIVPHLDTAVQPQQRDPQSTPPAGQQKETGRTQPAAVG